jgi:hypothetical protein
MCPTTAPHRVPYDLPYTTGPLARQYVVTLRTIMKLALPDRFLTATSDDAPETASEDRFRQHENRPELVDDRNLSARRDELATIATRERRNRRIDRRSAPSAPRSPHCRACRHT